MPETIPTRGAALALAEEQSFIETGFGFLDEKRMLLAATLLKELAAWQALRDAYHDALAAARKALEKAILRHGLEGVQLYPVASVRRGEIKLTATGLFGLDLMVEPQVNWPAPGVTQAPDKSDSAEVCRAAFARLVPLAARMAARQANVNRLIREYRATERRARALENVLLPEVKTLRASVNEHLEEMDQEEAIRIRNAAG